MTDTDTEKVEETAQAAEAEKEVKKTDLTAGFKEVLEKAEGFSRALERALEDRVNVVAVRINDDTLRHLDMLVEAGVCKSRSESAAFLINAGVNSSKDLFVKIESITAQITDLRSQLRQMVGVKDEE